MSGAGFKNLAITPLPVVTNAFVKVVCSRRGARKAVKICFYYELCHIWYHNKSIGLLVKAID